MLPSLGTKNAFITLAEVREKWTGCRPPIEMSPLSPFQMSLSSPGGCWERVTDDGDCDEPHGDRPDARAQGSGGWPDYGERGRAADVADAPPGVPAGQGLP